MVDYKTVQNLIRNAIKTVPNKFLEEKTKIVNYIDHQVNLR